MRVLGVDPGAFGALAVLDTDTDLLVVEDMPVVSVKRTSKGRQSHNVSEQQIAVLITDLFPDVAWVERVHAFPKQGVTSSFNFGMTFGMVLGALAGCRVPIHLITPTQWKRAFNLGADKQAARLLVARMFPSNAKTFARVRDDGRAEAALLAVFGAKYPL